MKNRIVFYFVLLTGVLVTSFVFQASLGASSPEVIKVVDKLRSMGSFRANVTLGTDSGGESGILSYQQGKFHLKLNDGRVIASNGRVLILYNPANRVAGKQDMLRGAGGAGWLLNGYSARVAGSGATLTATDPGKYYEEVQLSWGENYILKKISMRPRGSDRWLSISLSNVRVVKSFPASLFSWKPPAGSRTVENPLNQSS